MRTLPALKHCHYTNLSCHQTTMLLVDGRGEEEYWKTEDELFVTKGAPNGKGLYNMLLDAFGVKDLANLKLAHKAEVYQKVRNISRIKKTQEVLDYIEYITRPNNFSLTHFIDLIQNDPT